MIKQIILGLLVLSLIAGCKEPTPTDTEAQTIVEIVEPTLEETPIEQETPIEEQGNSTEIATLTREEAIAIARKSSCGGNGELLADQGVVYNTNTRTWWIDMRTTEQENCNPACVVSEQTKTAEIDWRCTGLAQ